MYCSVPWNTCVGLQLSFLSDYISMGTRWWPAGSIQWPIGQNSKTVYIYAGSVSAHPRSRCCQFLHQTTSCMSPRFFTMCLTNSTSISSVGGQDEDVEQLYSLGTVLHCGINMKQLWTRRTGWTMFRKVGITNSKLLSGRTTLTYIQQSVNFKGNRDIRRYA